MNANEEKLQIFCEHVNTIDIVDLLDVVFVANIIDIRTIADILRFY